MPEPLLCFANGEADAATPLPQAPQRQTDHRMQNAQAKAVTNAVTKRQRRKSPERLEQEAKAGRDLMDRILNRVG